MTRPASWRVISPLAAASRIALTARGISAGPSTGGRSKVTGHELCGNRRTKTRLASTSPAFAAVVIERTISTASLATSERSLLVDHGDRARAATCGITALTFPERHCSRCFQQTEVRVGPHFRMLALGADRARSSDGRALHSVAVRVRPFSGQRLEAYRHGSHAPPSFAGSINASGRKKPSARCFGQTLACLPTSLSAIFTRRGCRARRVR